MVLPFLYSSRMVFLFKGHITHHSAYPQCIFCLFLGFNVAHNLAHSLPQCLYLRVLVKLHLLWLGCSHSHDTDDVHGREVTSNEDMFEKGKYLKQQRNVANPHFICKSKGWGFAAGKDADTEIAYAQNRFWICLSWIHL